MAQAFVQERRQVERRHVERRGGVSGTQRPYATAVFAALAALVVLNAADVITTRFALHIHGITESNPLAGLLLSGWKVEFLKVMVLGALAWRAARNSQSLRFVSAAWAVVGIYAMTVVSNSLLLLHH